MRRTAWSRILTTLAAAAVAATLLGSGASAWAGSTPNIPAPLPGTPWSPPNEAPLPATRGDVPDNVFVAGHDISGMSESEALSVICAYVKVSSLAPVTATATGKTYTLSAESAFYLDTKAMLDEAYAANGVDAVDVRPVILCNDRAVYSFVSGIAAKTDKAGADARWYVSNSRLKLQPSAVGVHTDVSAARWAVLAAMKKEAAAGVAQPAVPVPVASVVPKVTEHNIGRAILVVISERHLRLYDPANGGGIMKDYRCAVGQPAWPTPTGLFKIVQKRYLPTWVNPGSSWGTNMPPYIGPGPNNPLGTRALNLNADGIRIHGTNNIDSIGTAASHGCVRLVRHDIEELYDLVIVGTPVFIIAR